MRVHQQAETMRKWKCISHKNHHWYGTYNVFHLVGFSVYLSHEVFSILNNSPPPPFYWWEYQGSQALRNLSKVTQLMRLKLGFKSRCLPLSSVSLALTPGMCYVFSTYRELQLRTWTFFPTGDFSIRLHLEQFIFSNSQFPHLGNDDCNSDIVVLRTKTII